MSAVAMPLSQAAERVGVSPGGLRRWTRDGVIPQYGGRWRPAAVGHARVVARMRDRGHSLREIRRATQEGRLAFGYIAELLPPAAAHYTPEDAARETGLEPALIERIVSALGWSPGQAQAITEEEVQLLRYLAAVLAAGLPLVAMLQQRPLPRIGIHYGDALYRDGDYYGRDVNIASRVAARSAGGEVLVTRAIVEHGGAHLEFHRLAEIKLKGFSEGTEIFIARQRGED
ncbi:MAG: MerR family transcriptional regulator [Solirubrobacteraceae bacterium]